MLPEKSIKYCVNNNNVTVSQNKATRSLAIMLPVERAPFFFKLQVSPSVLPRRVG